MLNREKIVDILKAFLVIIFISSMLYIITSALLYVLDYTLPFPAICMVEAVKKQTFPKLYNEGMKSFPGYLASICSKMDFISWAINFSDTVFFSYH